MKHLRQYIRHILLESPTAIRKELVKKLMDYNQYTDKEIQKGGEDYDYRSVKYLKDRDHKNVRRQAKIFWNEHADHDFFDTSIRKYHQIAYVGHFKPDHYFSKSASKNELSCFGGPKTEDALEDWAERFEIGDHDYKVVLEVDGYTTWAGNFDAYTEELSQADEEDKERMKSSGLAKRPGTFRREAGIFTPSDEDVIILDEEDFEENVNEIDEMIVDNWSPKTLWISLGSKRWLEILKWKRTPEFDDLNLRRNYDTLMSSMIASKHTFQPKLENVYELVMYCKKYNVPVVGVINGEGYDGIKAFENWYDIMKMHKNKTLHGINMERFDPDWDPMDY